MLGTGDNPPHVSLYELRLSLSVLVQTPGWLRVPIPLRRRIGKVQGTEFGDLTCSQHILRGSGCWLFLPRLTHSGMGNRLRHPVSDIARLIQCDAGSSLTRLVPARGASELLCPAFWPMSSPFKDGVPNRGLRIELR
jgi:hypothetical protein